MSAHALRLIGLGALAGVLAGAFVAIPATSAAHALILTYSRPTPLELAKSTCCGQVVAGFWDQVLPNWGGPGAPAWRVVLVSALSLAPGAALGALYVFVGHRIPWPGLLKATVFAILLVLPVAISGGSSALLFSPWEGVFTFLPRYPSETAGFFKAFLAMPFSCFGIGTAGLGAILDRRLPVEISPPMKLFYGLLTVFAGVGLLLALWFVAIMLGGGGD